MSENESKWICAISVNTEVWSASDYIDGGSIIENLQDQTYSECGEFAEGFLDDVSKEEEEELSEILNYVLNEVD